MSLATGMSLTAVTVTVIVDESLVNVPSLAVNVKLSVPLKCAFGVYVAVLPLTVTVPFVAVPTAYVKASPSTSDAFNVTFTAVSSAVVTEPLSVVGTSLTAVTVIDTVASVLTPLLLSVAV